MALPPKKPPKDPFDGMDIRHPYEGIVVCRAKREVGKDPYAEAINIIDSPWREKYGVETMIVDTIDAWAVDFMDLSAGEDTFAGKKGNLRFGEGTKHEVVIPSMGDYRAAHMLTQAVTNAAFDQDMHVIFCAHVGIEGKSRGDSGIIKILRAGAATVGAAQVGTYGGQFDQYWRFKYKSKQDSEHLMVQLRGDSVFNAKHREDGKLPERDMALPNTLEEQQDFWMARLDEAGIDLDDPARTGYARACLYGELGTGKTRTALCFPRGPLLYIAVDKNSEYLRSMYRELKSPFVKPIGV